MIIISQNRDVIANFDMTEVIDIVTDFDGTGKLPNRIYCSNSSGRELLGIYKTEERAKEVLDEIAKFYYRDDYKKSLEPIIGIGEIISRDKAAFYMPLE